MTAQCIVLPAQQTQPHNVGFGLITLLMPTAQVINSVVLTSQKSLITIGLLSRSEPSGRKVSCDLENMALSPSPPSHGSNRIDLICFSRALKSTPPSSFGTFAPYLPGMNLQFHFQPQLHLLATLPIALLV